ncbi:host attachment protein [Erythrobacter sp.]|uniref:baeRF12 domain-containing protein n=1 Tax=Erythrobacter sp. TaxID=1042 RepID=UPI001425D87A|nr:host attachment protein [Erythrobacter sp.]QIQ87754.1 MAG: attachment protein [Erythrobacter sp.]
MKLPAKAHVAVVDGESFALFRNEGQIFEPKLAAEDNPKLAATNFSAGIRHQDDHGQRLGRTDLNELAHGAAAAEWLNAKAIDGDLHDILVIADPKTLGEMRQHYHTELKKRLVGEIDKTLTNVSTEEIEKAIEAA